LAKKSLIREILKLGGQLRPLRASRPQFYPQILWIIIHIEPGQTVI